MEDLKSQLERIFLEVLPESMPIIEEPKFYPRGRGNEFSFECLVKVPYREDEKDGGFKVKFVKHFKVFDSDPHFVPNSLKSVAGDVAVCSCFARKGAEHVEV